MNKLVVRLPLVLGLTAALAVAATPPFWGATKKSRKAVAARVAPAPPPPPGADVPGSEMLKPPPKVAPIFPYEAPPGGQ